jgi:hypothetical protein
MEERLAGYVADLAAFDVGEGYPTLFERELYTLLPRRAVVESPQGD